MITLAATLHHGVPNPHNDYMIPVDPQEANLRLEIRGGRLVAAANVRFRQVPVGPHPTHVVLWNGPHLMYVFPIDIDERSLKDMRSSREPYEFNCPLTITWLGQGAT